MDDEVNMKYWQIIMVWPAIKVDVVKRSLQMLKS